MKEGKQGKLAPENKKTSIFFESGWKKINKEKIKKQPTHVEEW